MRLQLYDSNTIMNIKLLKYLEKKLYSRFFPIKFVYMFNKLLYDIKYINI